MKHNPLGKGGYYRAGKACSPALSKARSIVRESIRTQNTPPLESNRFRNALNP